MYFLIPVPSQTERNPFRLVLTSKVLEYHKVFSITQGREEKGIVSVIRYLKVPSKSVTCPDECSIRKKSKFNKMGSLGDPRGYSLLFQPLL